MSVRTSTQNVLLTRPRLFFKDGSPSTTNSKVSQLHNIVIDVKTVAVPVKTPPGPIRAFPPIGVLISSALNHKS